MFKSKGVGNGREGVTDALSPASEDEKALLASSDTTGIKRKALWTLLLVFGGFLAWAAWAPLDEGVPSVGVVTLDTKRKTVQHLTGGIVKEVLVREGQQVVAGEVLFRLDDGVSKANFESIRQRYLGLSAMQTRLVAEQTGDGHLVFQPDVLAAAAKDPYIAQQLQYQRSLFESRRRALEADIQGMREAIEGQRAQLESSLEMQRQRQRQLQLLKEELSSIKGLVEDGYVPRTRQRELERAVADTHASLAEVQGVALRAQRSIAELNQRIVGRQSEYRKEVETLLADVSREVQADAEKFAAQKADLQRIEIRAPATGQVVGLAVQTVGAVVQSGQKLMDIVPQEQQLLLEAQIPPHLIDKVESGLPVDIRFNTFANAPQLVVPGIVRSVSGDLLSDPGNAHPPYFLARLEVTPEGLKKLGNRQMQPGMPAEVVIKTGQRSMLVYLLNPLLKRVAGAMKEE